MQIARVIDPKAKIFVFSSTVRGRYAASIDTGILVVVEDIGRKYEIMVKVYREVEASVELHITSRELFEKWYRRFIDPNEIIEI